MATPETEREWLERAGRSSCRELEAAVAAESKAEERSAEVTRLVCRFVNDQTVRVTVDLTPAQFALVDQAIGAIRRQLGTEDAADALELIARAYLARVGEEEPAQLHHIRFFSRGGRHQTRNLLTLCTQHHRQLHEGHLVLRAGDAEGHRFTNSRGQIL